MLQLQRWGVLPRIRAADIRGTTFHYGDEVIQLAIRASLGGLEIGDSYRVVGLEAWQNAEARTLGPLDRVATMQYYPTGSKPQ